MGIVFRQSIKTSLVIFTGAFLGTLITWLSTKFIAMQSYGFMKNLTTYALFLSQVFLAGLNSTMLVFIHKYTGTDVRRKLLITLCLFIPVIFAVFATVPFYFLKPWLLHHFQPADVYFMQRYYLLLPVYTILFILQIILELYLTSQMKVAAAVFMREILVRVIIIALLLFYASGYVNFDFFVIGSVLVYAVPVTIYFFLATKTKDFGFSFKLSGFNKSEYRELLHFSWYHSLILILFNLIYALDVMVLPLYDHKGFTSVAVYSVAVFLVSFMQMPSKAMLAPTVTVLSEAIANNDHQKAKNVFERSSINVLIATLFMAILIYCNLGNAITVIAKGYEQIIPLFLVLFIGRFIDLATGLNDAVLSITKHYKFNFYVSVSIIAFLFLLIRIWVPQYSGIGAAWATTLTLILYNLVKYIFVWKKLDMQPFSPKTLLVLAAGVPALAAGYFFPHFLSGFHHMYIYTLADVCIRSLIIVIVYMLMLLWLRPSPDLEEYLASIKKNKRLF